MYSKIAIIPANIYSHTDEELIDAAAEKILAYAGR